MSRMQLVLVSLVPAFSGLALAAICGMSFLSYADQSPMMFKLVGVMGLLLGMVGVLMPPALWLMGAPPRAAAPAKEATKGKDKGKSADQDKDDDEEDAEEAVSGTMDADGVEFASAGDADVFAETDTGLEVFDDDSLVSGSEEFVAEEEVEEEFEEEEEAPKKKKKR